MDGYIPRNTTSRRVRLAKIDDLFAAGIPLNKMSPQQACGLCGDRMGQHMLVIDGDLTDSELIELFLTQRIVGTIENYDRSHLPYACGTFGLQPPLAM